MNWQPLIRNLSEKITELVAARDVERMAYDTHAAAAQDNAPLAMMPLANRTRVVVDMQIEHLATALVSLVRAAAGEK